MLYAEKMALIAGLCIVLYAYLRYWQRTRDTRGLLMFWRREMTLTVCLLYTSPSPRDLSTSRMPSSA